MAVGIQRALDSAIGLPSRSTSASWMLLFLMPAEVRRYFMMPLLADLLGAERLLHPLLLCNYGLFKSMTYDVISTSRPSEN